MNSPGKKSVLAFAGILAIGIAVVWWVSRFQQEAAKVDAGVVEFKKGNYLEAANQLTPYAQHGNKTARLTLGTMYAFGNGVAKDRSKAAELLSDNEKVADLYLWIGQSFDKGDGVEKDHNEAKAWYDLAAKAGNEDARQLISASASTP